MALWCRIKQSKLKSLSNQFKRCYFQIPGPCSVNHTASYTRIWVLEKPNLVIHKSQFEFCNNVRFFAAPVQAKPKQEEKDTSGRRLNEQIKAEFIRLVSDEGHGIVSRREALERAKRLDLDLVEVQRTAKPPVCKLMDYNKERYKQQLKEKERAKSKSEGTLRTGDCKEVRFTGKIEQKDLQMKADMVKRLMERGYRVKCTAMGNEDQDLGELLSRLSAMIEDVSIVESGPRVERKQAYILVRHVKFGPSKKGSGKKASKIVGATSAEVQNFATSRLTINPSTPNQSPVQFEGNLDPADSGLETEDGINYEETHTPISPSLEMPDKYPEKNKSTWSAFDASDDFDTVFDLSDDVNGVVESSTDKKIKTAPETMSFPENSVSDFMRPRPVLDSTRTDTVPSFPSGAPLGTENRYNTGPRNRFPPTKSMDVRGSGGRNPTRLEPQFTNQITQGQFGLDVSPPTREFKRVETDASLSRNLKPPADETPKQEPSRPSGPSSPAPSYGIFSSPNASLSRNLKPPADETPKQESSRSSGPSSPAPSYGIFSSSNASLSRNLKPPADETPKQEPSHPSGPSSPAPSYGIFSSPETDDAPGKHGVPAEDNKYQKGNPLDSAKKYSPGRVSANPNLPSSNSDGSQRPVADKGGQGRWGIFSRESSNVISSRTSESQAEAQR